MRERVGKEVTDIIGGRDGYGGVWGRCQGKSLEKCEFPVVVVYFAWFVPNDCPVLAG